MKRGGSKAASERVVRPRSPSTHQFDFVKVFGCRPTKMTPRTPGPAYANLQRRKPREGIRQTVRRALSKMVSRVISIRSREFSKNLGFEYVYNFGVMARVLLTGESRFLSSCDFKELRVKKSTFYNSYVSSLTTFFLQHSANRGTQKNFDAFKLKLFRFAGQDNHRISDCADLTSESLAVPT